jgi:chromosome segregation ATPase
MLEVNIMLNPEERARIQEDQYHDVLNDFHQISDEIQSLYHNYSKRIKNASEEMSKQKSKHQLYELEITENHNTIELLTAQIEHLLHDRFTGRQMITQLKHELNQDRKDNKDQNKNEGIPDNNAKTESGECYPDTSIEFESGDIPSANILPTPIPEIRIIYESTVDEKKNMVDHVTKRLMTLIVQSNEHLIILNSGRPDLKFYIKAINNELDLIRLYKKHAIKKERWYMKVWKFLWGKHEEDYSPEILKKLEEIERQLTDYADKFKEVNEMLKMGTEHEETTRSYLGKMNSLHTELKKIEEYYEEEIQALKTQLDEYKQKESELESQLSMLNKTYKDNSKTPSVRESELEEELKKLRSEIQAQSNKKNDLFKRMKQPSTPPKPKTIQSNPEFDQFGTGTIPLAAESKKTMFNPNNYLR